MSKQTGKSGLAKRWEEAVNSEKRKSSIRVETQRRSRMQSVKAIIAKTRVFDYYKRFLSHLRKKKEVITEEVVKAKKKEKRLLNEKEELEEKIKRQKQVKEKKLIALKTEIQDFKKKVEAETEGIKNLEYGKRMAENRKKPLPLTPDDKVLCKNLNKPEEEEIEERKKSNARAESMMKKVDQKVSEKKSIIAEIVARIKVLEVESEELTDDLILFGGSDPETSQRLKEVEEELIVLRRKLKELLSEDKIVAEKMKVAENDGEKEKEIEKIEKKLEKPLNEEAPPEVAALIRTYIYEPFKKSGDFPFKKHDLGEHFLPILRLFQEHAYELVTSMNLSNQELSLEECKVLASLLSHSKCGLEKLDVSYCSLDDEKMKEIAEALEKNSSSKLETLKCRGCVIKGELGCNSLGSMLSKNRSLINVSLVDVFRQATSVVRSLFVGLLSNDGSTIQTLSISGNRRGFSFRDFDLASNSHISSNTSIKSLVMGDSCFHDECLDLGAFLKKLESLEVLHITNCNLTDNSVSILFEALVVLEKLKVVSLDSTVRLGQQPSITKEGFDNMIRIIHKSRSKFDVTIGGIAIGDEGLKEVVPIADRLGKGIYFYTPHFLERFTKLSSYKIIQEEGLSDNLTYQLSRCSLSVEYAQIDMLNLMEMNLTNESVPTLCDIMKKTARGHLRISGNNFEGGEIGKLFLIPTIKKLNLSGNMKICNEGAKQMMQFLSQNRTLTHLWMGNCGLDDKLDLGFWNDLFRGKRMVRLDVSSNHLGDAGIRNLVEALDENRVLVKESLQVLEMNDIGGMTNAGISAVSVFLARGDYRNNFVLSLDDHHFTDEDLAELLVRLREMKKLRYLFIRNNKLTVESLRTILRERCERERLKVFIEKNRHGDFFRKSSVNVGEEFHPNKINERLVSVLSKRKDFEEIISEIKLPLEFSRELKKQVLIKVLCSSLENEETVFEFSKCGINMRVMEEVLGFASMTNSFGAIKVLDFSVNPLGDSSVPLLCVLLGNCELLEKVDLSICGFSDKGLSDVLKALLGRKLTSLEIAGNIVGNISKQMMEKHQDDPCFVNTVFKE